LCEGSRSSESGYSLSIYFLLKQLFFVRGKGDYYRLGHGSEDHIRRPKQVAALESMSITSICCGSLHCVVTTTDGDIYCWGDNDEGQLGDNTTNAGHQPNLCVTLQVCFCGFTF